MIWDPTILCLYLQGFSRAEQSRFLCSPSQLPHPLVFWLNKATGCHDHPQHVTVCSLFWRCFSSNFKCYQQFFGTFSKDPWQAQPADRVRESRTSWFMILHFYVHSISVYPNIKIRQNSPLWGCATQPPTFHVPQLPTTPCGDGGHLRSEGALSNLV